MMDKAQKEARLKELRDEYNAVDMINDPEAAIKIHRIHDETVKLRVEMAQEQVAGKQAKASGLKRVMRRWKLAETWWFKHTGWKRKGHLLRGLPVADLTSEMFSLEVTTMQKMPASIAGEMKDAEGHARPEQIALVAMHEEGADMMNGVVMMRVRDFLNLHVGKRR